MNTNAIEAAPTNGATPARDLFALTDEQILEIEPEPQDVEVTGTRQEALPASATPLDAQDTAVIPSEVREARNPSSPSATGTGSPFAATEEVRALAELYPGGLSQAKTTAERARTLDEIDAAYFGSANSTPEQISASRAQLAQRMMRENPAAFREMVFAGLRALEASSAASEGVNVAPQFRVASSAAEAPATEQAAGLKPVATSNSNQVAESATVNAYAAFERTANEELQRSVGGAIERTIAQALPNLSGEERANNAGARSGSVSLRERLASSVRQDVEAALKGDRQLGEQIAQILAARRFDSTTRSQVVRLINDRAQQLVPGATRRVVGEWTSATLAAHGAKNERTAAASSRRELAPAASVSATTSATQNGGEISPRRSGADGQSTRSARNDGTRGSRSLDYRRLSDEQILDL